LSKEQNDIAPYPEDSEGKFGLGVAKWTLHSFDLALPFLGTVSRAVLESWLDKQAETARAAWLNDLATRLQDLRDRVVLIDDPSKNAAFISTLVEASEAARRARSEEKREALVNAVANMAIGMSLDEVLRARFIALIERYTPKHLNVLSTMNNPAQNSALANKYAYLLQQTEERALGGQYRADEEDEIDAIVIAELRQDGLIHPSENPMGSTPDQALRRTTKIGEAFVRFISNPI
jgi:hypothetical protein